MRFVSFLRNDAQAVGLFDADAGSVIPLREAEQRVLGQKNLPDCLHSLIGMGEKALDAVRAILKSKSDALDRLPLASVALLAPIPRPAKNVFCVGQNYLDHVNEIKLSNSAPEHPIFFSKLPTAVIGPDAPVDGHADLTQSLDYEGELAVVIGKKARKVAEKDALDYVFGYTILNDVTARNLQKRHGQWMLGKGLDTFCPMGPYLTHSSLVPDPAKLRIETRVNGEIRQSAGVSNMIFSIPRIIACITQGITLEPGDIIATGTPSGVGAGFTPPKFLKKGDVVEISITELGSLRNTIA